MRRVTLAAMACLGVGCSVALGFDHYSDNVDCVLALPPDAPKSSGTGTEKSGYIAAFSYISLEGKDKTGRPVPLGFDLDGLCTCPGALGCKPLGAGPTQQLCDEPKTGRDRSSQGILTQLAAFNLPVDDRSFNAMLQAGRFTEIIRLDRYNGAPDDADVTVSVINGIGLANDAGAPTFQGDTWRTEPFSNGVPTYNVRGWVTGGVLVAHFEPTGSKPALVLSMMLPGPQGGAAVIPLTLSRAILSAAVHITPSGDMSLTNGNIGGVLSSQSALDIPRAFGICPGTQDFEQARRLFCSYADLPNKDGLCDSDSLGVAFEAVPAKIDGFGPLPLGTACADAGPSPSSCAQ